MPFLFELPSRCSRESDKQAIKKATSKPKKTQSTIRGGNGVLGSITAITSSVNNKLGKYKDKYAVLRTVNDLSDYIDSCIDNGVVSIDTETEGLDVMRDKIAGVCLYTPNRKAVYVPINHIDYITGQKTGNQISEEDCATQLRRLCATKVVMFNADFDIRVLRHHLDVYLDCYFDCYIAARCLNENEPSNKLKDLHNKYCLNGEGDAWTFDSLFKGVIFTSVPINSAYLYAARDAEITYELYLYQRKYLDLNSDREDLRGIANVFYNIEMPCVKVVADMEDNGIEFDTEKQRELSDKYHKLLDECEKKCYDCLAEYERDIDAYRNGNVNCKLDDPINLSSPSQLSVLLYDIIGVGTVDKKNPRGTGSEILEKIDLPICRYIVEFKKLSKLVSAFVDSLPEFVGKDGRIHCRFNQYGANTGRMSCQDPNLQQIPSHNKDIRNMFKAADGCVLISSDFSQQEPKTLAAMCAKDGDTQLLNTFRSGKDLYSEIASKAFNVPYEDCLEFYSDGRTNAEGKKRRSSAKTILLGVLYGRGTKSVAEQLNCSVDKAQDIKDSVFKAFPAIREFEQRSKEMAYSTGYVTTVCGRKRRLPDIRLPEFEFRYISSCITDDLLNFDLENQYKYVSQELIDKYMRQLERANLDKRRVIIASARKYDDLDIKDNCGFIAQAERQCVNARIQGGAADLTKLAMIRLANSEELKNLNFKLLIPVHDEIIAECPIEHAKVCGDLLSKYMSEAAEDVLNIPIRCDVTVTKCWYGENITV